MHRIQIGALALLLIGGSATAQTLQPTAKDIGAVRQSGPTYRSYPQPNIVEWELELRAALAHASSDRAADAIAAKHGFTAPEMRRLVNAWVIAQSRQYAVRDDQSWKAKLRADLLALVPTVRRVPLGLMIIAETLDAMDEGQSCPAANFDPFIAGSTNPAADAFIVANAAPCSDNFVRAALVASDRAMPALIRMANWGSLPPRDTLPLYSWLTSPVALARISERDRPALSALLWQRYLELLLKVGLTTKALALLDSLPAEMRARVLAARDVPLKTVTVDGIAMTFGGEGGSAISTASMEVLADEIEEAAAMLDDGRGSKPGPRAETPSPEPATVIDAVDEPTMTSAPLLQVATALAAANRDAEARALLETLPGLAAARKAAECQFQQQEEKPAPCPDTNKLPMAALTLDHLLNDKGEDPYPIAEATLSDNHANETPAGAEIRCRVFPVDQFPALCAEGRESAIANAALNDTTSSAAEVARGDAALTRIVPGFAVMRDGFVREAATLYNGATVALPPRSYTRATVTAVTPGFAEHPLPAAYRGNVAPLMPKDFAKLSDGFELVRAERDGTRAIAISLSQTFDPTGEVSRGGYWVHLSEDGGKHWQKPLYTGLADRFPYVVAEHSPMPLLSGDTVNLAVDVAEIDTSSITYPPVALRTRRRAAGLYLEIPLAGLQRDTDGDGLTDVAARHLLVDRARKDGGTPFVVGSDRGGSCSAPPSPERQARIALLGKLFDPSAAAIVEPTDRPEGEIMTGWQRAAASTERPLFLQGDPRDYACLRPSRPMIVYGKDDVAAIEHFTPDFHPVELPPIIFNRAHDRGFVRWSTGWAGGTYRLRLVDGQWKFDSLSSWIT